MNNIEKEEKQECMHNFELSSIANEATEKSYVYHDVGYSTCTKCGKIIKQDPL